MLERLQQLAHRYAMAKPWLLLLALLSVGYCGYTVVSSESAADDMLLIPSLLLFIWATMLHSFLNLFAVVPIPAQPGAKGLKRFKARCQRGAYQLFAVLIILLTLALVVTTLQLAGAWRMMY